MRVETVVGLMSFLLLVGFAQAADQPAAVKVSSERKPAPARPKAKLDLRVGNVRNYMMPNDFQDSVAAPDPDRNTVIVEGERVLLPLKSEQPIPDQLIAPFWALANPLQSWRVFVPDPNRAPPGPPEVVPGPVFRRGP